MSTQYYFIIRSAYVLFIGSAGDYKPTTIHKMSAESFCCFPILKSIITAVHYAVIITHKTINNVIIFVILGPNYFCVMDASKKRPKSLFHFNLDISCIEILSKAIKNENTITGS